MPFPSASSCLGPPSQTYSYKLTYVLRSLLIFPLIWGGWRPVSIHHSSYSVFQFFPLILPFSQPTYRSRLSISKPTNKGSHSSLTRSQQYWVSFLHILVPLRAIHIWNLISFISYFTTINILTSEHSPYTPFAPHILGIWRSPDRPICFLCLEQSLPLSSQQFFKTLRGHLPCMTFPKEVERSSDHQIISFIGAFKELNKIIYTKCLV